LVAATIVLARVCWTRDEMNLPKDKEEYAEILQQAGISWEKESRRTLEEFATKFADNIKPADPDFEKIVDEHLIDLV